MKKIVLIMTILAASLFAQVKEPIEVPYIPYEIRTGKNFDVVYSNCLTCHSFGYVLNQGRQSKEFWKEKVNKMIVAFKAPITDEDAATIGEYLFEFYGNGEEK